MNIPNGLSIFRICLVPCFITVFFAPWSAAYVLAAGIFLLAGLTDMVAGYIARKFGQVTMLGRLLDPLADKLMVFSALVCITIDGLIPVFIAVLFFGKEAVQAVGTLLLFRRIRDVPPSTKIGKLGTTLFYASVALVLTIQLSFIWKTVLFGASFGILFAALVVYIRRALLLAKLRDRQVS